jgi:hypothetical protein
VPTFGSLFAGIGGIDLGLERAGWECRDRGNMDNPSIQRRVALGKQVNLGMAAGGALNPTWVEWLMGFPLGWTDLGPSETRSSRRSSK